MEWEQMKLIKKINDNIWKIILINILLIILIVCLIKFFNIPKLIPNNFIASFLNIILIDSWFIQFDYWMIVHFITGLSLGFVIKKWQPVLILLVLYEFVEIIVWGVMTIQEPLTNIVWDILFGMFGWFIISKIKNG